MPTVIQLLHSTANLPFPAQIKECSMSDLALPGSIEPAVRKGPDLDSGFNPLSLILFMGVVAAALLYVAYSLSDVEAAHARVTSYAPYLLLFVALLIAFAFEFVNGFHDTANAVATVIYTRALPANFAVVWSGLFNLLECCFHPVQFVRRRVASTGELILQVGSSAGFAMVFALLVAAMM